MKYLLDTSAVSEMLRRQPKEAFLKRLQHTHSSDLTTSAICAMELRFGCALKGDLMLWDSIQTRILGKLHILPFGAREAERCGDLLAVLSRQGTPIGIEDTQIGATALEHGLNLVTGNVRHFERIPNLTVENWVVPN